MTIDVLPVFREIGAKAAPLLEGLANGRELAGENPLGQRSIKADLVLEQLVIDELTASGLGHVLETEEQGTVDVGDGELHFVCDPLDGSGNYFRGVPFYGLVLGAARGDRFSNLECSYIISLVSGDEWWATDEGAFRNGERIQSSSETDLSQCTVEFDPVPGERVYDRVLPVLRRCRDVRRYGANAVAFCLLAQGALHAFLNVESTLSAIHAPGLHIAQQAGCVIANDNGSPFNPRLEVSEHLSFVSSANPELQKAIQELM